MGKGKARSDRAGAGEADVHRFGVVFVGGGPAAMAPFLAAAREGDLGALLARRVAVVEAGDRLGCGTLGGYDIESDTEADTFAQCVGALAGHDDPLVASLGGHPASEAVLARAGRFVHLRDAADLMALVGRVLGEAIEEAGGAVLLGHRAVGTARLPGGGWATTVRCDATGRETALASTDVVLATGGTQDMDDLSSLDVAGVPLAAACTGEVVTSSEVLRVGGREAMAERLGRAGRVRVAVVGGGASALSVAAVVAGLDPGLAPVGWVSVLHRSRVRLFYGSVEAARRDGYSDFGPGDVCPATGAVLPLTGVRNVAPPVRRAALGGPADGRGTRVRLHRLDRLPEHRGRWLIRQADTVVVATGYAPRLLPVHDARGGRIALAGEARGRLAADADGHVLDGHGKRVPGLHGIGLGYAPPGLDAARSEPGHKGPLNDVARWNTGTGLAIARALMRGGQA